MDGLDFDEKEVNFVKVKKLLNEKKIKLWLHPYVKGDGNKNPDELKKLADSISAPLGIDKEDSLYALEKLQAKAIRNYNSYNRYLSTGEATLKVKVFMEHGKKLIHVVIDLDRMGYDLKLKICRAASLVPHRLRIIFRGKFILDEMSLKEQNIKHGFFILAIAIRRDCKGLNLEYDENGMGEKLATDIVALTQKGYLQSTEQFKRLSDLKPEDRIYLVKGLRLHQIGRTHMGDEEFAVALAMLLEAKENFDNFESSYLEPYRNFLLNLDIVFCYLNIGCLALLPDAEERLRQCEQGFVDNFGTEFQRIRPRTDFHWMALILLMRLHLLQFVTFVESKKIYKGNVLMKAVERELRGLKTNLNHLKRLLKLGYTQTEAQFAMRESQGNMKKAIEIMERNREKMTKKLFDQVKKGQYKKSDGKDPFTERIQSALRKCLLDMGYTEEEYKKAVERKKPLYTYDDEVEDDSDVPFYEQDPYKGVILKTVITIGFQRKKVRAALRKNGGDYEAAIRDMFKKEFLLGYESYLEIDFNKPNGDEDDNEISASTNINDPKRAFSFEFREPVTLTQMNADGTNHMQFEYIDTNLKLEFLNFQLYQFQLDEMKKVLEAE